MAIPSPIRSELLRRRAEIVPYGHPDAGIELVQSFGALDLEYAALRTNAVLIDQPQRATIEITGSDRIDFLDRMLTQQLKPLAEKPLGTRNSFWLNRQGRIVADLRVLELGDRAQFDVDVHAAQTVIQTLSDYIFTEDVQLRDQTRTGHRLALIGPTSAMLLEQAVESVQTGEHPATMEIGNVSIATIAGASVVIDRQTRLGVDEFAMLARADDAERVYLKLLELGMPEQLDAIGDEQAAFNSDGSPADTIRLRPAGWHAFNTVRIEAGVPMFYLDFGPDSLPAETGVFEDRVSLTKGCYLGQEIVARMHSLGHPKKVLVALRCEDGAADQPVSGAPIMDMQGAEVGAVTSSSPSPLLGGSILCFAMVKWGIHEPGTVVSISTDSEPISATVQQPLRCVEP
ncbi:MAG TPA: aminomethyl transferase family protein [Phycisphaerales bacterium]|nr:aminomethyl transferase family protein [Phycisphaerales bacterium]